MVNSDFQKDLMKSTIPQLETMLQEANEKKSPYSKSIEKWLLSKYCSKGVSPFF